jgi:hypothetical protein
VKEANAFENPYLKQKGVDSPGEKKNKTHKSIFASKLNSNFLQAKESNDLVMAPPARGESQQRRQVVGEDMENNFPNFEIKVPKSRSVSRGPPTPPRYDEHLKKLK